MVTEVASFQENRKQITMIVCFQTHIININYHPISTTPFYYKFDRTVGHLSIMVLLVLLSNRLWKLNGLDCELKILTMYRGDCACITRHHNQCYRVYYVLTQQVEPLNSSKCSVKM